MNIEGIFLKYSVLRGIGAINIANYWNFTKNSKHIEIHYHFFHECVKEKEIEIVKVDSNENITDIFTKALCKEKFTKFRELLNVKWKWWNITI